ncbi:MAG: hypothetical protein AB2L07_07930 [Thermoanaerobaculaceae bacterium]
MRKLAAVTVLAATGIVAALAAQAAPPRVVFDNGEAQVVDLNEKPIRPGIFTLPDFADDRKVDHVRMVALAVADSAKVIVTMEK